MDYERETAGNGGHGLRQRATLAWPASGAVVQSASVSASPVLLTERQAAACLGVSMRKFHDLRREPWMPAPIVLGPRLHRWVRSEIESAAVSAMPRQSAPGDEPAHLLRARIERAKQTGSLA